MRETIGSTWIYQLVILFILIFVSFLILALTYSKSFKTKNEVLNIIEKYEGVNKDSVAIINNYLTTSGYKTMGGCPDDHDGAYWIASNNLEATSLVKAKTNEKYYYCLKRKNSSKPSTGKTLSSKFVFYEVALFYKFNLPVIGNISTFTVNGVTSDIIGTKDLYDTYR